MAIIKKRQLREMKKPEIKKRLNELRLELSKERAQIAIGGTPSNTGGVGNIRRTVAKLLTRLKEVENA